MNLSIRTILHRIEPESNFVVHAPEAGAGASLCAYRLIWATRLHHEMVFTLPDGGFHQVNLAFVEHPVTNRVHAFIIASHQDHEGPWQEFISCDELLDCHSWDSFLDHLYGYRLESGLDLSITNRDTFIQLLPEWLDLLV